jgi:hypothetical protein
MARRLGVQAVPLTGWSRLLAGVRPAPPSVFVNYRVCDQPGYATLVHRELSRRFGPRSVFLASSSIRAGDDYVDTVFNNLARCDVVLAIIGPRWTHAFHDVTRDWVHRELVEAFTQRIRVVPLLIEDTAMPNPAELPADLTPLTRRQYLRLRHYGIDTDLKALVRELEPRLLATPYHDPTKPNFITIMAMECLP